MFETTESYVWVAGLLFEDIQESYLAIDSVALRIANGGVLFFKREVVGFA
ncbi:MAG TPA: hypothetical protein VMH04_07350 [Candidatus Solibacter sp.]|nr:hypothetical protein [Candidatus Solibacter sp.]